LATDSFLYSKKGLTVPSDHAVAVTPNDSTDLANTTRALYVGVSGDIVAIMAEDDSSVTFKGVGSGAVLPLRVKRILATGTTATDIVALY